MKPRITLARVILVVGIIFIGALVLAISDADQHIYGGGVNSVAIGVVVIAALIALVAAGNLTYGKNSHYSRAWDRIRPVRSRPATPPTAPETAAPEQQSPPSP